MKTNIPVLLIVTLFLSSIVFAHPPTKISLEFNAETFILKVVIQTILEF